MAFYKVVVIALLAAILASPEAEAGNLAKAFARSAMSKLLRRDVIRAAATVAKPLSRPRRVWRYTSRRQAAIDARQGLAQGRHMTARVTGGRSPSGETAQRRYGLVEKPEVRETWRLQPGMPIRFNKALGGAPGTGEITSTKRLQPESLIKMTPLKPLAN